MKRMADIRQVLLQGLSRKMIDDIVMSIDKAPQDFTSLYELIKHTDSKVSWRAAWACEKLCDLHPDWFIPYYEELTMRALTCQHSGTRRILLSILFKLPVPALLPIPLLDFCLLRMLSPEEPAAVQSLCIRLAYKIGKAEPELLGELGFYLQSADTSYYSPAVNHSIKKIIKKISTNQIE